jgi:hypothetical protein
MERSKRNECVLEIGTKQSLPLESLILPNGDIVVAVHLCFSCTHHKEVKYGGITSRFGGGTYTCIRKVRHPIGHVRPGRSEEGRCVSCDEYFNKDKALELLNNATST